MAEYYRKNDDGSLVPVILEQEGYYQAGANALEPKPKPIDWNRYKGCVVEMASELRVVDEAWFTSVLEEVKHSSQHPYRDDYGDAYTQIRLPSSLTVALLPHDGSDQCPVDDPEQLIVYMYKGCEYPVTSKAKNILRWHKVTAYLPLNFVLPE